MTGYHKFLLFLKIIDSFVNMPTLSPDASGHGNKIVPTDLSIERGTTWFTIWTVTTTLRLMIIIKSLYWQHRMY